jgi:hypothetical protein
MVMEMLDVLGVDSGQNRILRAIFEALGYSSDMEILELSGRELVSNIVIDITGAGLTKTKGRALSFTSDSNTDILEFTAGRSGNIVIDLPNGIRFTGDSNTDILEFTAGRSGNIVIDLPNGIRRGGQTGNIVIDITGAGLMSAR